jgi:enamine deaminase RidA (YjgF/YER057c/UK114 family)
MKREVINPASLFESMQYGFSHAIKKGNGTTTIHCAGQTAWDKDCNLIGGDDIGAQAKQALANLKIVLAESCASVADIVRIRTYVVNHTPEYLEPVGMALAEFYGDVPPVANTWIGVQ